MAHKFLSVPIKVPTKWPISRTIKSFKLLMCPSSKPKFTTISIISIWKSGKLNLNSHVKIALLNEYSCLSIDFVIQFFLWNIKRQENQNCCNFFFSLYTIQYTIHVYINKDFYDYPKENPYTHNYHVSSSFLLILSLTNKSGKILNSYLSIP